MYFQKEIMKSTLRQFKKWLEEADAVVVGAGAGLSTAAGFEYGGKTFLKYFRYMKDRYGYEDMYSAGFHDFSTEEEKWGYWSMFVYLNRYRTEALPLYLKLYELLKKKNYFVITTNVDHQFQKAGFAKERIFYTQGDYGLFQCSVPCHLKTYDNEQIIKKMIANQKDHRISEELLPKCPVCGKPMSMNLRSDDTFVEDEGWKKAAERYVSFLQKNKDRKILFLELGVGWNTPGIIKIPFMKMTEEMPLAHYVCINTEKMEYFEEIESRSIFFQSDLKELIEQVAEEYEES